MYIDYFCLGKPRSELFKTRKSEGLLDVGDNLTYWEPIYGDATLYFKYVNKGDEIVTFFKDKKGKSVSYPLVGKFFVGRHNKGFYEKFGIFGANSEGTNIVLTNDYSSLMPRLVRPPENANEILELLTCDPRFLKSIEMQYLIPILEFDHNFLKHLKSIILNAVDKILNAKISDVANYDVKDENRLKKRYIKEVNDAWRNLTREIKRSNLNCDV